MEGAGSRSRLKHCRWFYGACQLMRSVLWKKGKQGLIYQWHKLVSKWGYRGVLTALPFIASRSLPFLVINESAELGSQISQDTMVMGVEWGGRLQESQRKGMDNINGLGRVNNWLQKILWILSDVVWETYEHLSLGSSVSIQINKDFIQVSGLLLTK